MDAQTADGGMGERVVEWMMDYQMSKRVDDGCMDDRCMDGWVDGYFTHLPLKLP